MRDAYEDGGGSLYVSKVQHSTDEDGGVASTSVQQSTCGLKCLGKIMAYLMS